ncbi:UNVERIFIED_CONTAM: Serine/arginine-rich splicing factor SC35 [Sesamum radiatum]|uniref:Serine/arginine-rich splicing factor SC35 n=1 Tax=Sesamum radiatum TaxID=300843 RepID=A0AAW2SIK3_SESRA
MSHFGRSGPPDIRDTYSLLVLNITFRNYTYDGGRLVSLFDKYGKVVDVFIPRDRRTGDSRGFAFVRYKYQDEAQKAVEKLDVTKGELKNPFTGPEEGHEAAVLDQVLLLLDEVLVLGEAQLQTNHLLPGVKVQMFVITKIDHLLLRVSLLAAVVILGVHLHVLRLK